MRYGYWLPVFGGWLRNVDDENMAATWEYSKKLAQRSEQIGYDLTLVAELNLNDIKGESAPSLDAWSTAAALTAVTNTLGHWIRMVICFCSFGFVYPNAFVEGMDLTAIQRSTEGDLYNK